jgi:NTE family protein
VPPFVVPDVLVLAAGGVLGEAWMSGVLGGIEDAAGVDLRRSEAFIGTSAGAIVAARLAAGRRPRRPDERPPQGAVPEEHPGGPPAALRALGALGWAATAPAASAAMAIGAAPAAMARAVVLARLPRGTDTLDHLHAELRRSKVRFDGRLRVCCVDRRTGRRVVGGAPGAPPADVADAVVASCAIPWRFTPVAIDGREYVDGGMWSATNLDAAPAGRDTEVLCLDPIAGLSAPTAAVAVVRSAFRLSAELEIQRLRARGARVRHVTPDRGAAAGMGADLMDARPAARVLAEGYRQGRAVDARRRMTASVVRAAAAPATTALAAVVGRSARARVPATTAAAAAAAVVATAAPAAVVVRRGARRRRRGGRRGAVLALGALSAARAVARPGARPLAARRPGVAGLARLRRSERVAGAQGLGGQADAVARDGVGREADAERGADADDRQADRHRAAPPRHGRSPARAPPTG